MMAHYDVASRHFSMNALACDPFGNLSFWQTVNGDTGGPEEGI
jgi:hypothetical protein